MTTAGTAAPTTASPDLIQQIEADLKTLGSEIITVLENIETDIVQAFGAGVQTVASAIPGLVLTFAQSEAQAVATALTTPGTDVAAALTTATNNAMTQAAQAGIAVGQAAVSAAIATFAHAIATQQTGTAEPGA